MKSIEPQHKKKYFLLLSIGTSMVSILLYLIVTQIQTGTGVFSGDLGFPVEFRLIWVAMMTILLAGLGALGVCYPELYWQLQNMLLSNDDEPTETYLFFRRLGGYLLLILSLICGYIFG